MFDINASELKLKLNCLLLLFLTLNLIDLKYKIFILIVVEFDLSIWFFWDRAFINEISISSGRKNPILFLMNLNDLGGSFAHL
jgi:hypothetical protein